MSAKLLTPTALLKGDQLVHGESVLIEDGRIVEIGTGLKADSEEELEGVLLPGAIDLQVNGAGGRSVEEATAEATPAALSAACRGKPRLTNFESSLSLERRQATPKS